LGADPSIISFGGGYPDATLFPAEQLDAVFHEIITAPGGAAMQYAPSNGLARLRDQVAELMRADGVACTGDDVLILQGSQQGLDFAARMLVDPCDRDRGPDLLGRADRLCAQPARLRCRPRRCRGDAN
jgi:DNA-binding transcriptional MocR family regulator